MIDARSARLVELGHSAVRRIQSSNYDISNSCNLRCEGCLYFSGAGEEILNDEPDLEKWRTFFVEEARRGVTFAYVGGAEPSLVPKRVEICHEHIPLGVVFTNGTRRIPAGVRYRIHVSVWGNDARSALYRGASLNRRAMRNYAGDKRAVFIMTLNALNLEEIEEVASACADHGLPLAFSLFSPTVDYLQRQESNAITPEAFFDFSAGGNDMGFDAAGLARAKSAVLEAHARRPDTIRVSPAYLDWITSPGSRYKLDDDGLAMDCRNRLTHRHRHFNADLSRNSGKCCSPNLDCGECRPYAMSLATLLTRRDQIPVEWEGVWNYWSSLFLPLPE